MFFINDEDLYDPHPDINNLFSYYNSMYFQGSLGACSVEWSSAKMVM